MPAIENVFIAERILKQLELRLDGAPSIDDAKKAAAAALSAFLGEDVENTTTTLEVVLDRMLSAPRPSRDALLFTARLLNAPNILPEGNADIHQFERRFVSLFEQAVPDIAKLAELSTLRQTIDKINALRGLRDRVAQLLEPLAHTPSNVGTFPASKQGAFQTLNNQLLKSYLAPYGFSDRAVLIREIYNDVAELVACKDATFVLKLEDCERKLEEAESASKLDRDLFSVKGFRPFVTNAQAVLSEIRSQAVERLRCAIKPRRSAPNVVERRFPLHESNRIFRVTLPLVNEGPGLALDTVVTVVADSGALFIQNERLAVGTVQPGEFAVTLDVLVGDAITSSTLLVDVQWSTAQSTARQELSFEALLQAQKPDVPWDELEGEDPYSTEVAKGDEFFGRRARVAALGGRFLRPKMQSSYITGQKRVGKTSLSFAVRDYVNSQKGADDVEFIYLEYGDYANSDAAKTVSTLGHEIATRLLIHLPAEYRPTELDFSGSIAALNRLAQHLQAIKPTMRFVLILDEFDEIHPEMYRYGPLAEAFFSNLRTLSAKQNFALMLVGGENMPFIIGAQGDQLNKLVPEQLSYFSRSSEWEDYVDLVRLKDASPLTWYESALAEIFRISNGHPYYTKLLCARIFQNAVRERDTDVTVDEVGRAGLGLVESLDTNAFAHLWKDGIAAGRDEAEVVELKRKRVLVAIGQTRRSGEPLTLSNIVEHIRSLSIAPTEVSPILIDFVRRDIMRERNGEFSLVLPLFEEWLVQKGVGKLIVDALGDEMAEALRVLEDEAFVSAGEIAAAIEPWPPYIGKAITVGDVQAWLEQRPKLRDRRLLFKLLQKLRFVRDEDVREKLRVAHTIVKQHMGQYVPETRSQRRFDIVVTYVDGPGKSGAKFAERYAEVNLISSTCVVEQKDIAGSIDGVELKQGRPTSGIVIVDDIAATGTSLSKNVSAFVEHNRTLLIERRLPVVVIALFSTKNADMVVRNSLAKLEGVDIDFRVCEILDESVFAFSNGNSMWADHNELSEAKVLMEEVGRIVQKAAPLGVGGLGLLVAFGDTVPNNTLPVIHASGSSWRPLLPRPKN
ncbi:MAG: hypothetical protein JWR80_487 [Bradyrhizobium sp.]|nr:hypothetical protein [Bradyrhizobium sp.]